MLTVAVPDSTSTIVNASTFCIASTSFNPEKFNTLLQVMIKRYLENLDPTKALEVYLSIHTTGNYQTFQEVSFPDSSVAAEGSVLKELSDILGPETVIRDVVYSLEQSNNQTVKIQCIGYSLECNAVEKESDYFL